MTARGGGFSLWLRARLRTAFPVPYFDEHKDDELSSITTSTIERNNAAISANIEASNGVSEAVRRTLLLMGAAGNEKH